MNEKQKDDIAFLLGIAVLIGLTKVMFKQLKDTNPSTSHGRYKL
tara:strand:- start:370 stop:501 length:132 start_codon:yes stop_codon:yes gene_type:complete